MELLGVHFVGKTSSQNKQRHETFAAPKACMRGDVVMVEQLLFFGISPDISCIFD